MRGDKEWGWAPGKSGDRVLGGHPVSHDQVPGYPNKGSVFRHIGELKFFLFRSHFDECVWH